MSLKPKLLNSFNEFCKPNLRKSNDMFEDDDEFLGMGEQMTVL
jgi:hypothetical protein